MHEDYLDRAVTTPWSASGFKVMMLAPVDLAISKLSRWAEHDQADVRSLIDAGDVAHGSAIRIQHLEDGSAPQDDAAERPTDA